MIVNTAYPFMGKKEPQPADIEMWGGGRVYYPYNLDLGSWDATNNRFYINQYGKLTLTLPLSGAKSLKFKMQGVTGDNCYVAIQVRNDAATKQVFNFGRTETEIVYAIPEAYRTDNVRILLQATSKDQYINSGLISFK